MVSIHPTAIVDGAASLGNNVRVGPYCILGPHVEIGDDVTLESHVVIQGKTKIGKGCHIYPFASIGSAPQDLKFNGEDSRLEIGEYNTIRESVTINPGTESGGLLTKVGSHCLFMVGSHIAHDCHVGDHVILANNATLAGHVTVGDYSVLGGLSAAHQFVRIGEGVMVGGISGVIRDLPPFAMTLPSSTALINGINMVGLRRRGISKEDMLSLRDAYDVLFFDAGQKYGDTLKERCAFVEEEYGHNAFVKKVLDFLSHDGGRGISSAVKRGG